MRVLKGFIGCWLAMAACAFLALYAQDHSSFHPANFAATTGVITFVVGLILALAEKPAWRVPHYAATAALTFFGVVAVLLAPAISLIGSPQGMHEWTVAALAGIVVALIGAIAGGGYRLFAGAKAAK